MKIYGNDFINSKEFTMGGMMGKSGNSTQDLKKLGFASTITSPGEKFKKRGHYPNSINY